MTIRRGASKKHLYPLIWIVAPCRDILICLGFSDIKIRVVMAPFLLRNLFILRMGILRRGRFVCMFASTQFKENTFPVFAFCYRFCFFSLMSSFECGKRNCGIIC